MSAMPSARPGTHEGDRRLLARNNLLQRIEEQKGRLYTVPETRDEIILNFKLDCLQTSNNGLTGSCHFMPAPYPPCVMALCDLKKILINDLAIEIHHRGSYILLRAITPMSKNGYRYVVVEDEAGSVVLLQLFNHDEAVADDGRVAEGTVMLVKEPYLKLDLGDNICIRVDHLTDILFPPEHDSRLPSQWHTTEKVEEAADAWKNLGNELFKDSRHYRAINCYSKALESRPTADETLAIRHNRALAFLKTHQFDAALADCETNLSSSLTEKALFYKAQALYHLGRFQESCDTHKLLGEKFSVDNMKKGEYQRALDRLSEQKTGKYPFKKMQVQATKRFPPLLDHATYVGPITVKNTASQGRGLFTTAAVRAGDLLLCEKAFEYSYFDKKSGRGLPILVHTYTNRIAIGNQPSLVKRIIQKIHNNPSLATKITELCHGSYQPLDESNANDQPVVDAFLIERIVHVTAHGCLLSSRDHHIRERNNTVQPEWKSQNLECPTAIWPVAAHGNHSCLNNASPAFIGDMFVVRAAQDLPANTELKFWYKSPISSDCARKGPDLANWGFQCTCGICEDFRETPEEDLAQRQSLLDSLSKAFKPTNPDTARIASMLAEMEKTYRQPAAIVPRLAIFDKYMGLSTLYFMNGQSSKALQAGLNIFKSLGYTISVSNTELKVNQWGIVHGFLIGCWISLARNYMRVWRNRPYGLQALGYAKITYKICFGEDETFEDTYDVLAEHLHGFVKGAK
ncbi:uncharacterized protein BDV14DRAFT_199874 [Aspergillus stella-maris]|uniref:uncharacterized protein n=1 Tax=Aspergillus stella-maris TaxID=1810926 RepID=UPI003CCDD684